MKYLIENEGDDGYAKCPECGWDGHMSQMLIEPEAVWSPKFCPSCLHDMVTPIDADEVGGYVPGIEYGYINFFSAIGWAAIAIGFIAIWVI